MADGPLWALNGTAPTIAPDAWVAPTAVLIGDVTLAPRANVWWHCVLRGDDNPIRIGEGSNIQDGTIIHIASGRVAAGQTVDGGFATIIGRDVTVGHACLIHACTLEDRAFVGMGATVLDGAVIEEGGMLAAGGLLTPGKRIGRNELWGGAPARLMRVMSVEERAGWDRTAPHYVELARRFRTGLTPVR